MRISILRPLASDQVIVDWLELKETFEHHPFTRKQTQDLWICSQPQACRRLQALERYQLITVTGKRGWGGPWIYRVNPA